MSGVDESRVERWEKRAEVPLLLLGVAFVVAYGWPVLNPRLDPDLQTFLDVVSWAVWGAFGVDFVIRVALAADRKHYLIHHWYDLALIILPLLRPLRLLRLLAFARILNRSAAGSLIGRVTTYVFGMAVAAVFLGALAVLDIEQRDPDANIKSFGDALWWACTTVTTVGYGDRYPVTTEGRFVAVALMIIGLAMVGVITASVAAWLVRNVERQEQTNRQRAGDADRGVTSGGATAADPDR